MIFSVIVPFLNEEKHIARCAESLLAQNFPRDEYELIFIDNCSADRSREILARYPSITVLIEETPNVYVARNRGLKVAKGDVIAFTDADCSVSPHWLAALHSQIRNAEADIVLGIRQFPSKSRFLQCLEDYENAKADYVLRHCPREKYYGYTNNMAVKRCLFERNGCFNPLPVTGDTEFVQRCAGEGDETVVLFSRDATVLHLEIKKIGDWLKKVFLHGKYNRLVAKLSRYSKLGYVDKARIFLFCIESNQYCFIQRIILGSILFVGDVVFRWGGLCGFLSGKNENLIPAPMPLQEESICHN